MTVTETTSTSWFSRLGDAFKGILGGLALIFASICLLFWNEGRTLHRYQDLEWTATACVSVKSDSIDPANDGKPVYTTGEMKTEDVLSDAVFPAVSVNALKLNRKVEMFQWQEEERTQTRKKLGGGEETVTTYSYKKVWSEDSIDSGSFKEAGHDNPGMDLQSEEISAESATLGAFDASALIPLKNDETKFDVKPAEKKAEEAAPEEVQPEVNEEEKAEEAAQAEAKTEEKPVAKVEEKDPNLPDGFQYFNGGYYRGKNPGNAEIGDLRVSFTYVPNGNVSVIAGQQDEQLIEWQSRHGTVMLLQTGTVSQEALIANAQSANKMFGWLLRAVGVVLMFIGFNMLFKPLSVLADVVPFIGNLVEGATGIIAFILALSLSFLTIGVAWVYYRPLIGIPLVIAAVVLFIWAFMFGKKKNPEGMN